MILYLSGYDKNILEGQSAERLRWLTLSSAWVLVSIFLCATSAATLIHVTGGSVAMMGTSAAVTLFSLLALQAYGQTSIATTPLDQGPILTYQRRLRLGFAVLLSVVFLIFTQPFLMLWANNSENGQRTVSELRAQMDVMRIKLKTDGIRRDIAQVAELQSRLPGGVMAPSVLSKETPAEKLTNLSGSANRRALLIGNDDYRSNPLKGSVNDVRDMERLLKRLGFRVEVVLNGNRKAMQLAVENYSASLRPGDISFFHYSGHGFQSRGSNYLAPVDYYSEANTAAPNALGVNGVIESIGRRNPLASVVLIDACRTDGSGGAKEGFAALEAGANTYIALAARPGQSATEAESASGRINGLFTSAILRHLGDPIDIDQVFRAVRSDVAKSSKKINPADEAQETWTSHNLNASLILTKSALSTKAGAVKTLAGDPVDPPIFLEPLVLSTGERVCTMEAPGQSAAAEILMSRYRRCLQARSFQLSDDLTTLEGSSSAPPQAEIGNGELPQDSVESSLLKFRAFWGRSPFWAMICTTLLVLLFSGGAYWRASLHDVHVAYDEALHQSQKALTKEHATSLMQQARTWRHAPSEEHLWRRFMGRFSLASTPEAESSLEELVQFIDSMDTSPGAS